MKSTAPHILTESEAAEYVGKSVKTLQRRRQSGQIAFIRDGGRISYLRADLDAYLSARRVAAYATPPVERAPKYRRTGVRSEANRQALLDMI